ncbi:c-type cytochrome [Deinococcus arcticus]|uniref:Cytochrome c, class I n=1 Tax=Deinococcus arcticus TaxID=2136176 RepID=A0A2T3W933_9DEIO|nr:cytochrome c [Deinococcus arcticus]PTA68396.1 cytochrome c, class I [Deinococcus arcticus]
MSGEFYSGRQVAGLVTFLVVGAVLGVGAYQAGGRLSGAGSGAQVSAAAPSAPDGQALYAGNCAGCHGAKAEGGLGPGLAHTAAWGSAEFTRAVLDGQSPQGRELGTVMPRFRQTGLDGAPATDAQVAAIQAYVQTLK